MRVGCIIVVLLSAGIACGQTISADFENFIEGDHFRPSFTDPHSGIFFTNSTAANQNFVIEYANDPRSSFYSNNKFLSANGLSFGPGFGLPGNFGFTAILPNFASRVTLDAGVSDTLNALCTLTLTGYDSTNRIVDSNSFRGPVPPFSQTALRIDSTALDIDHIILSTENCFVAYDNITINVPEASGIGGALAMWIGCVMRHKRVLHRPTSR